MRTRSLANISILIDHADKDTEIRATLKCYKEDVGYIWRIDGAHGDPVETIPVTRTLREAKKMAQQTYRHGFPWYAQTTWRI